MRSSDYYRIEATFSSNDKKFSVLENLSLCLKILAIVALIVLFKYFYIAIILWIASIVLNFFKRNLIYKYVYIVRDGKLEINKEYSYDKSLPCESVDLRKAEIVRGETEKKYYEGDAEFPITVKSDGREFSINADEYLYALAETYKRGTDDIFR
ncbi:MAG: hypothetical protein MR239_04605 [Clostridiales bacterium]|nr:hypothetical protein [Clostridiales bacterium]MDY4654646.1 hypothetical protein [Eubacteriales bacterium]